MTRKYEHHHQHHFYSFSPSSQDSVWLSCLTFPQFFSIQFSILIIFSCSFFSLTTFFPHISSLHFTFFVTFFTLSHKVHQITMFLMWSFQSHSLKCWFVLWSSCGCPWPLIMDVYKVGPESILLKNHPHHAHEELDVQSFHLLRYQKLKVLVTQVHHPHNPPFDFYYPKIWTSH